MTDPSEERRRQWAEILTLTARMHELAEGSDWAGVARLEEQRRALLKQFFATDVAQGESAMVADGIRAILAVDRRVMAAGAIERERLAEQIQEVARGRAVNAAYSCNL